MKGICVHLKTAKFPVMDGERDEMINEGMYGKAISLHLQRTLAQRGYDMPDVVAEDWGWWVTVGGAPFGLGLCVYCWDDTSDVPVEYAIMSSVTKDRIWSWRKFRMIDAVPVVTKLMDDVEDIMNTDPEVEVIGRTDEFPM